jgi:hypothetical protein
MQKAALARRLLLIGFFADPVREHEGSSGLSASDGGSGWEETGSLPLSARCS